MKIASKKKNPIKRIIRKLREYFFFRNKRPLFEVNFNGIEFDESNFKDRGREEYFEYAMALKEVFTPNEIIDIGCANGYLIEYFHKHGIRDVKGLEAAEAAFKYMAPEIKDKVVKVDLSRDIKDKYDYLISKRYYLANCTEVGEHIPCKYESVFLKNIERCVGRYLALSWADTWEGWHGMDRQSHVNPRSKRYVIKRLGSMGLRFDKNLTSILVGHMKKRHVYEHWINRIMVFERLDYKGD